MTRQQIEEQIWNVCMRLGSISGELHNVRCGNAKEPQRLPYKLVMMINQNFNDLYEVERFFAPINKAENLNQFRVMLDRIAPFKVGDVLFEGCLFSVENRSAIKVTTINYE